MKTSTTLRLMFVLSIALASIVQSRASGTCTFTVPENVCTEQQVKVYYTGTYPATAKYNWYFSGATVISGTGQGPYVVKWSTAGEKQLYVTVTSGNDSCSSTRLVKVKALPALFTITGGGIITQGGTGVQIGLSGSQTGTIYTLLRDKMETKIIRIGTGSALDFGLITEAGVYTCKARFDGLECYSLMNGSATVATGTTAACAFTVPENVCTEQQVKVYYTGTYPATAKYNWYFSGATVISGTGQGPYVVKWSTAGEKQLYVTVTSGNDSCSSKRLVQVKALPALYTVTGGGTITQGGTGVRILLSGSQTGVIYTLLRDKMETKIIRIGTGSALDFGLITEAGIYTCKARFDGLECYSLMNGSATVATGTTAACAFTVPENVFTEQQVKVYYTGTYPATAKYNWYFSGATVISGTGQGPYVVKWSTAGEKQLYVTVTSGNDSCSSTRLVKVKALPALFTITGGGTITQGGTGVRIGLSGSQTGTIYTLLRDKMETKIIRIGTGSALDFGLITEAGVYTCKARFDGLECYSLMNGSATVNLGTPNYELKICMVTFDQASSRNKILWNKPNTTAIHHFNIYRETTKNNQFQKVAEVPFTAFSSWVDPTSEPLVRSYRYKISATDNNQAESPLSLYHKTIHLNVMAGYGSNNLTWNNYEGFEYFTYRIHRRLNSDNYQVIDSVASNINSYTDFKAGTAPASYFIEVVRPAPCAPTKSGEIVSVISNSLTLLPEGDKSLPDLRFSPNPVIDKLSVRFQAIQEDQSTYVISSSEGRIMQQGELTGGELNLNFSSYRKGLYVVKIMNGKSLSVFKVMK